jgi:hypothetical protein
MVSYELYTQLTVSELCLNGNRPKSLIRQSKANGDAWGRRGIAPPILTSALERREWSSGHVTSRSLYFRGKSPDNPLDWRLDGSQGRYGFFGEEKNRLLLPRVKSRPTN